jgi:iron complex transport system permease protein
MMSRSLKWLALVLLLVAFLVLELSLGTVVIPFKSVISILSGGHDGGEAWRNIVLLFRLPRALTAMFAGAALGVAGLMMQTLFRNPLAEPYILGVSSGASLGVALVVMVTEGLGWDLLLERAGIMGSTALVVAATVGAMAVLGVVLSFARRVEGNTTLLIIGLMFGYLASAVVNILMQFSVEHQMQRYVTWTFGSFGSVTWHQMKVFAPTLSVGIVLALLLVKPLNAFLLGDGYARSMGVNVRRVRFWIITGAAILAGTVTAYCGPIAFLGIAVPHLCRLLWKTSDHRELLPAVVLMGATLALFADRVAQVPGGQIALPLNSVTSLIGAPVVVAVILRRRHVMEAGA